ncbi:BlaR1 peptidase M56 [Paenibacillus sp. 32O-W]|uniref:M56 family metallopeptidase n=1 Tax=Paenibacillus sp. 32O-W TaxID=1695218 RepID=UPI0007222EB4|nr:M56 family metallopeptidase [Paenibacillus sp. 32O-W]ALS28598.1 BlaR1 peptidase M56 [Paenibacillus sp. 32O-W]
MSIIYLYYQLLIVSIIAGVLYLTLTLLSSKTLLFMSAKWHYYTRVSFYFFLLTPYLGLFKAFLKKIGLPETSAQILNISSMPLSLDVGYKLYWSKLNEILFHFRYLSYLLMAGTLIYIVLAFIQNYRFNHYIFRVCRCVDDLNTLNLFEKCKKQLGISKKILVYSSPYATTPFISGVIRPYIILPEITLTSEELKYVFFHELTHWKRHDPWLKYLMILVQAIHWYNPIVYLIRRDIDRFCELSCDESVTRSMNREERRGYCSLLLKVLWNTSDRRSKLYSALSGNKKKQLERRIDMILKQGDSKQKKWSRTFAIAVPLLALLIGAVTAYAASGQDQNTGYTPVQNVEGYRTASAPAGFKSDGQLEYTPQQSIYKLPNEQSASAPSK